MLCAKRLDAIFPSPAPRSSPHLCCAVSRRSKTSSSIFPHPWPAFLLPPLRHPKFKIQHSTSSVSDLLPPPTALAPPPLLRRVTSQQKHLLPSSPIRGLPFSSLPSSIHNSKSKIKHSAFPSLRHSSFKIQHSKLSTAASGRPTAHSSFKISE